MLVGGEEQGMGEEEDRFFYESDDEEFFRNLVENKTKFDEA